MARQLIRRCCTFRYNNKTYKIDDIMWDLKPTNEFEVSDGTKMTFVEYYKTQHGKTITDLQQPLLVSQSGSQKH